MPKPKSSIDVKLELLNQSPTVIATAMKRLTRAIVTSGAARVIEETNRLGKLLGETMALADVLGRKRALMEVDYATRTKRARALFSDGSFSPARFCHYHGVVRFDRPTVFPEDSFREAFEDLIGRDARLANSSEEIRRVYSTGGFALRGFPKNMSIRARETLTKEIQKKMAQLGAEGTPADRAKKVIAEMGNFTEAYAQTAYRTNLSTVFTSGRKRQMAEPEVREIAPAFEYDAVEDPDTRPNHHAAKGLIAGVDHGVWDLFSPPLGYN